MRWQPQNFPGFISYSPMRIYLVALKITWIFSILGQCKTQNLYPRDSTLFSHSVISNSLWPHGLQHARLPWPSPSPGVCSNSCPLTWWCHPIISSFVAPFFSCPQPFLVSGSFPMSWLFTSGGQSIGTLAPVLPMNIQCWFPLILTGLFSLQSKGLSRVFSSTAIRKHQFISTQPSL